MSESSEISLARVVELCRQRDVRLAYEIGAFVVFEACEAILASPRALRTDLVWVSPAGETRAAEGTSSTSAEAAVALAELLAAVLVVAGQEVPSMLLHLVDVERAEALQLDGYRDELEAALVPLNRAAARRVLSRQLRELARPRQERLGATAHEAAGADADVDALLGYTAPATDGAEVSADSAGGPTSEATGSPTPARAGAKPPVASGEGPTAIDGAQREDTSIERAVVGRDPDMRGIVEGRGGMRVVKLGLLLAVVLVVAGGLYLWLQGPR